MSLTPQHKQAELNSKYYLTVSAFVVFILVFFIGLISGNELTIVLRNAAISAVFAGILMKICLYVIESNIEKTKTEQNKNFLKDYKPDVTEEILKITKETGKKAVNPKQSA